MANAPTYNRDNDFAVMNLPKPSGDSLNQEFDGISASVNSNIANLDKIQRDDGELENGIVKPHTLSAEVLLMLVNEPEYKGEWKSVGETELLTNPNFTGNIAGWDDNFGASYEAPDQMQLLGVGSGIQPFKGSASQIIDVAGASTKQAAAAPDPVCIIDILTNDLQFNTIGTALLSLTDIGGVGTQHLIGVSATGQNKTYWEVGPFGFGGWRCLLETGSSAVDNDDPLWLLNRCSVALTNAYFVNDMVDDGTGNLYMCIQDHFAGETLLGDVSKGYWVQIGGQLVGADPYAATTGVASAYAADFSPNAVLADGTVVYLKWHVASADSATLDVDGSGPLPLQHHDGRAIEHDDLTAGQISMVIYNDGKWVVHTNADRRTQIALTTMYNDDTSPALQATKGAFAYFEMAVNTKVWLPSFSFRPIEVGVQTTTVELHLELAATAASPATKECQFKMQAFVANGFDSMTDAFVAEIDSQVVVPIDTSEFIIDVDLIIPNTVDFSHMSISVERIAVVAATEHPNNMALFHVEGRL